MQQFTIEHRDDVAIATMSEGENRVGTAAVVTWNRLLDGIEADDAITSVVVTGADRYWSTGLDLDEMAGMTDSGRRAFMRSVDLLLGRILTAPFITVAALNGHTYAAGALLALAHDYRVMREDRGYFCLPSVDVGIPFSPGMSALILAKLPQPIAHDLVVRGRRIGGIDAASYGAVNRATSASDVIDVALDYAHTFSGKDPSTLRTVKRRLYPEAAGMLTVEP